MRKVSDAWSSNRPGSAALALELAWEYRTARQLAVPFILKSHGLDMTTYVVHDERPTDTDCIGPRLTNNSAASVQHGQIPSDPPSAVDVGSLVHGNLARVLGVDVARIYQIDTRYFHAFFNEPIYPQSQIQ